MDKLATIYSVCQQARVTGLLRPCLPQLFLFFYQQHFQLLLMNLSQIPIKLAMREKELLERGSAMRLDRSVCKRTFFSKCRKRERKWKQMSNRILNNIEEQKYKKERHKNWKDQQSILNLFAFLFSQCRELNQCRAEIKPMIQLEVQLESQ